MSYYVMQSASKRTKVFTSFALALVMVFQAIGPGVFALNTAQAVVGDYCHNDGEGHWSFNHDSTDPNNFIYGGTHDNDGHPNDNNWCGSHAPQSSTAHILATKVVCASESDLPDWATGQNNAPASITGNTATDFVTASNGHCHLQSGWQFQWGTENATDPGGAFTGPAAGPSWTTFTNPTDVNGITSATVPIDSSTNSKIWVREVLQTGYIPFTYDPSHPVNDNHVSAEMYCGSDVKNYDNYEQIDSPSNDVTYHCVAFNVAVAVPCLTPVAALPGDKITTYGTPYEGHPTLQEELDTHYGAGVINDATDDTGYQAWSVPAGTDSVTIHPKFVAASAGISSTFGYYTNGDGSTFVPLFTVPANSGPATIVADPGNFVINTTGVTTIGFAIKTSDGKTLTSQVAATNASNAGEDHAVVFSPSADTYTIAFEDLLFTPPNQSDKDYNDLVAEVDVVSCTHGGNQCVPSSGTVSSDTTTNVTDIDGTSQNNPSVVVTPTSVTTQYWTATTGDANAKWVWSEDPVQGWTVDKTVTFTKTFSVTGTPTSGSIVIGADNTYDIFLNGTEIGSDLSGSMATFGTAATYPIPAGDFVTGSNTLVIKVKNLGQAGDALNNPAGLLYTLSWNSDCGGGGPNDPGTSKVHIEKYVDGNPANFSGQGAPAFPIHVELGNGAADVSLDSTDSYSYTSDAVTNHQNTVTVHEKTIEADPQSGSIVVSSSESCTPGDYYIDGYSSSDTSFADAATQTKVADLGTFQGIAHDKYVIIWNKTCPTSAHIVVSKIICPTESELPNWGLGQGGDITANTASDFLAAHQDCQLNTDWTFQWAPSTGSDAGGSFVGSAGSPWSTPFTGSVDVPVVSAGGSIHMREVLQNGYIPFTNDPSNPNNNNNVSAEFYCSTDHLNYDNLDFINNPTAGQTYYCVGWNVPTATGHIIVKKITNPDSDTTTVFHFQTGGTGYTPFDLTGGGTNDQIVPAGSGHVYGVTEGTLPTGWASDGGKCDNNQTPDAINLIGDATTVTCTFTNTYTPPVVGCLTDCAQTGTLEVIKHVVGSNESPSSFTFSVDGGSPVAFNSNGVNDMVVGLGSHTVTETPDANFTTTYGDNCSSINVTNGGTSTCDVTNTFIVVPGDTPSNPGPSTSGCPENCNGFTGGGGGSSGGGGGSSGGGGAISGGGGNGGGNNGQVLGAFAAAPGLPDTGNGAESQTLMTVLALLVALVAINTIGLKIVRKS